MTLHNERAHAHKRNGPQACEGDDGGVRANDTERHWHCTLIEAANPNTAAAIRIAMIHTSPEPELRAFLMRHTSASRGP